MTPDAAIGIVLLACSLSVGYCCYYCDSVMRDHVKKFHKRADIDDLFHDV